MKQPHSPLQFWLLVGMLIILVLGSAVPAPAQAPSIEGTYQLVSRKLPDGTVQRPPNIMGALTYTKTHRNFNVIWKDAQGKFFSYSLVSTYKLTPTEYSETILFSILNDQISGKEVVYNLSRPTQSVPVTVEGNRTQFKLPFDPPSVVFEGDKMTATAEGQFVDVWEKVQ
jgi:hypothetical protein